jgi:hypothetical protein
MGKETAATGGFRGDEFSQRFYLGAGRREASDRRSGPGHRQYGVCGGSWPGHPANTNQAFSSSRSGGTIFRSRRYFPVILRGLFLQGDTADVLLPYYWSMAIIALVNLSFATWLFRHRMN